MPDINWNALIQTLAQMAQSRAQGQLSQSQMDAQNANTATNRYQAAVNASRLQNIEQPSANANQMARGSLWANWQPVSVSHPRANIPTISGGAPVSDSMRQMGQNLMSTSLARQQGGNPINTNIFGDGTGTGSGTGNGSNSNGSWIDSALGYGVPALGILNSTGAFGSNGWLSGLLGGGGADTASLFGAGTGTNTALVGGNTPNMQFTGFPEADASGIQGWQAGEYPPHAGNGPTIGMGGGAGARSSSRTSLDDMIHRQQLNEFGIGPDDYLGDSGANLENTILDRIERNIARRTQRNAWR